MTAEAVKIRGLEKSFRSFKLGALDLTVPTGAIYGFIGPNGAGKTTTIDLIIGSAFALFLFVNCGSNDRPVFRAPVKMQRWEEEIHHSRHNLKPCSVDWDGLGRTDLLVGSESGWFHLFRRPVLTGPRPTATVEWSKPGGPRHEKHRG